jgi:hypothetical protein
MRLSFSQWNARRLRAVATLNRQWICTPKATCGGSEASTPRMIRKLKSGEYRLYSRKKDASTGKRRNLGTFSTLDKARQHEREVQYFKKH